MVTSNSSKVSPYIKHLNGERLAVTTIILVLSASGYAIGWLIAIVTNQNKESTVTMIYGSGTLFQQILAAFYGSLVRRVQMSQCKKEDI